MLNGVVKQRCAAVIREIGIPVPFDLAGFCARLELHRGRPIHLVAVTGVPDAPSGLWVSTADADYIYHPEGLSPLHRAHIVLHEIAHMLLGHRGGARVNGDLARLLAPDVGDGMARLILGRSAYATADEQEAEVMASLLLERATRPAGRPPGTKPQAMTRPGRIHHAARMKIGAGTVAVSRVPVLKAVLRWGNQWRSYRQLHPLWSALHLAVPQIALTPPRGLRLHIGYRLYRRVIEIRDGELALRVYRDADITEAVTSAAAEAGLTGDMLNSMVQATVLAAALHAKQAGRRARRSTACAMASAGPGLDLLHETASLRQVSRAFSCSPLLPDDTKPGPSGSVRLGWPGSSARCRSWATGIRGSR